MRGAWLMLALGRFMMADSRRIVPRHLAYMWVHVAGAGG